MRWKKVITGCFNLRVVLSLKFSKLALSMKGPEGLFIFPPVLPLSVTVIHNIVFRWNAWGPVKSIKLDHLITFYSYCFLIIVTRFKIPINRIQCILSACKLVLWYDSAGSDSDLSLRILSSHPSFLQHPCFHLAAQFAGQHSAMLTIMYFIQCMIRINDLPETCQSRRSCPWLTSLERLHLIVLQASLHLLC